METPLNDTLVTDTRSTIETPEGADLPFDAAGMWVRITAFLIDALIKLAMTAAAGFLTVFIGETGYGLYLIIYFLVEWFYPVVFEVWKSGQTPGKKSMGIVVVNDDGTPVTFAGSLLRNLLRFVDFLPVLYVSGFVTSVLNTNFKRIGDLAAGTMVVYSHSKSKLPQLDIIEKKPMPNDFTTDEQRALLNFAERSKKISLERQQELAVILAPVLGEGDIVNTIKKMANSSIGGR